MDDPDRLRIQYEIAVLQHQQNLVELAFHQVDVIRRRIKRRGHRRFWVRPWIGRRRQFDLYNQLLVELRNEDQASFKNFMRMPPPRDVRRATNQSGSEDHQAEYKLQRGPRPWSKTCPHSAASRLWDQVSLNVLWAEVPHNNISLLIPKVCQAIIEEYKDGVMKCPTTPEEWRAISDKFAEVELPP